MTFHSYSLTKAFVVSTMLLSPFTLRAATENTYYLQLKDMFAKGKEFPLADGIGMKTGRCWSPTNSMPRNQMMALIQKDGAGPAFPESFNGVILEQPAKLPSFFDEVSRVDYASLNDIIHVNLSLWTLTKEQVGYKLSSKAQSDLVRKSADGHYFVMEQTTAGQQSYCYFFASTEVSNYKVEEPVYDASRADPLPTAPSQHFLTMKAMFDSGIGFDLNAQLKNGIYFTGRCWSPESDIAVNQLLLLGNSNGLNGPAFPRNANFTSLYNSHAGADFFDSLKGSNDAAQFVALVIAMDYKKYPMSLVQLPNGYRELDPSTGQTLELRRTSDNRYFTLKRLINRKETYCYFFKNPEM